MTPVQITLLLTVLAAVVVVLTRVRLAGQETAGRTFVPPAVGYVHTAAGLGAIVCWVAMLLAKSSALGWVGLLLWWVTAVCGLLILIRWLPPKGRHASDPVADSWGEGPGLSILAHVGMLVGVVVFTLYLVFGQLPPS